MARISAARPVVPAHSSPGTGLLIGRESLLYFLYSLYDEATLTGDSRKGEKRARRLAFATRIGTAVMAIAPLRWFVTRFFLPRPGDGPSAQQQLDGFYDLRFVGSTARGDQIQVKVTGDRDPGYGSTAKMLAQAAISLRRDIDKGEVGGGFWTPATVFGNSLLARLQSHAGMTFELLSVSGAVDENLLEDDSALSTD